MIKRLFDFVFASLAFVVFFPVIVVTYIIILKKLGKPVIFSQRRPGKDEKIFELYKFRTMKDAFDQEGNPLPDNERLTPTGDKIRKLSIDELPQLVNVVKGDLSIVGPRPLLEEYLPLYSNEQRKRHLVKPGLTGWAQVNGRNTLSWDEKFEHDLWYVNHQSFLLDCKIIFKTISKVVKRKDVQQKGHATMEKFRGNKK